MANHKSAKTRINRNNKRSIINGARRSRVRTFVKKVNAAILENNKEAAKAALIVAESELMRAAQKGVCRRTPLPAPFLVFLPKSKLCSFLITRSFTDANRLMSLTSKGCSVCVFLWEKRQNLSDSARIFCQGN